MTEHIVKRFEIIGAAASILAAAWFFLRPNTGGTSGAPGAPGAAGAAGIGYGGAAGAAGEAGAGGQGGAAGVDGVPGAAGGTFGNSYFSPFYQQTLSNPISGTLPTLQAVTSNLPPQADVPKRYASIVGSESIPKKEPCGCGCPNQAVAAKFPDGGGSCLSSTTANLQTAMNDCQPGNLKTSLSNILSNLQRYYGNSNPTPAELNAALFDMRAQFPSDLNMDALVPQSTFGAS